MKIPNPTEITSHINYIGKYIKLNYPEFYNYLNIHYKCDKFSEKLYNYYYPNSIHNCLNCNKPTNFISFSKGYHHYCSYKCANSHKDKKEKTVQTCLKKYGTNNVFSNKLIKEKIKQTNLEKYGTNNVAKNESIKEKTKQTNLERYGVESTAQNIKIKEKTKQTNLERYGVENPFQSDIIKEKISQTNLWRYGAENPIQSDIIRDKIKQTNLERYGFEYAAQSDSIKEKIKQTCLEKYGVDCNLQSKQTKQLFLKKYGVEHPTQNKYIKQKVSSTLRENNINRIDDLIGYTNDGEWICKCPHSIDCNKCTEQFYITSPDIYNNRSKNRNELCTKLFPIGSKEIGISNNSQLYFDQLDQYFPDSIYYKKSGYEYKIGRYSLDFYIPSLKIDIEFNEVYWHAKPSLYNSTDILNIYGTRKRVSDIWDHDRIRKEYIESKGIKVITVWEDDLPNPKQLKYVIKNNKKAI